MNESTISIANQIAELMLITDHRPRNQEAFSQHLSEMRTRLKELLSVSNSAQQIDSLIP
jgi:transcriptional regulator GlxA family with amidase domain